VTRVRRDQPLALRAFHWVNVVALVVVAGSGLQILLAYPYMGARGQPAAWYPFQGVRPPSWLRLGDWLAGARHVHFAIAWLLVLNAAVYVAWLLGTGEWRRRLFLPRRDLASLIATARAYLRLDLHDEGPGLYNGLQRMAYTSALLLGAVAVLSGLCLYKPVQLAWLASLAGGYEGARAIHLLALAALAAFTLGHLAMVLLHPRALATIFTGGARRAVPPADGGEP
jgi:thiosulfate reductase cytochrome b subunit